MDRYITLLASPELVEEITKLDVDSSIRFGRALSADALTDAVDAPIGPEEIKQIVSMVTIACTTSTAAISLLLKIKELVDAWKKSRSSSEAPKSAATEAIVRVVEPRTGKALGSIDDTTSSEELERIGNRL